MHTSYQLEAERILYRHVSVRFNRNVPRGPLNTLKNCPQKALWVRSLTVEFPLHTSDMDAEVLAATGTMSLCTLLRHTRAVIDLRIRLPMSEDNLLTAQINEVLR